MVYNQKFQFLKIILEPNTQCRILAYVLRYNNVGKIIARSFVVDFLNFRVVKSLNIHFNRNNPLQIPFVQLAADLAFGTLGIMTLIYSLKIYYI